MKPVTVGFIVALIALNAAVAWFVTTRVQMQVFLDPNALAFRVGSQMPDGAADRGTVSLTRQSQLPSFGKVLISSADGTRTFSFDRLFHGDQSTKVLITEATTGVSFAGLTPGARVQEALDTADRFSAFLTAEGFTPNPRAVEASCLRLDQLDASASPKTEAINTALATGMCGARSGSFMVFRKVRGQSSVTATVFRDPEGGGGTTLEDAEVTLLVTVSAGER